MSHPPTNGRIRLAVIADFAEEKWPSMDLVADMLTAHLRSGHSHSIETDLLRPTMNMRFSGLRAGNFSLNLDRLGNRFFDYPHWLKKRANRFDRFHIADHSYAHLVHALPPERTVVCCHDLDAFRCLLDPASEPRPFWFRAMARRILSGLQLASHVVCVSQTVKDEILSHSLLPAERISVVPNGVDEFCSPDSDESAEREAANLLNESGNDRVFIMNVGSTIPRKRIDLLLRILAGLVQLHPNVRLIRVGGALTGEQAKLAAELKIEKHILTMPFLDRRQLAALYRRAALLVQPSQAEGFGLPLAEAMACGTVVLASDIPVFREVGADAATYCSLENIPAWVASASALLAERSADPASWKARRDQSLANAVRFSWDHVAAATARIHHGQPEQTNFGTFALQHRLKAQNHTRSL